MNVDWQAGDFNPRYDYVEQIEESGLHFLKARCDDAKLGLKVKDRNVIIYDPYQLEQNSPSFTLVYGDGKPGLDTTVYRMSGGKFYLRVSDTAKGILISNYDVDSGMNNNRQFTSPDQQLPTQWVDHKNWRTDWIWEGTGIAPPPGKTVKTADLINYDGDGSDNRDAMAYLRDKNRHKYQAEVEMSIGNPLVAAGQVLTLSGCGQFDGQYFIEQAKHTLDAKYTTELLIRHCLEGY
jgi:hypothetical protein